MRMTAGRQTALALAATLSCGAAHAMPATTNKDYVACTSEEYLKDMTAFVAANDRSNFAAYIQQYKCVVLKDGMKVTVIDGPGMFGGRASFIIKGVKLWAPREALNYGQE